MNSVELQNTKSICKNQLFLYINNKISEREIKKTIPFTIVSKRIKYVGINVTKEVEDLYTKKYKVLKKEIEEDSNKWEESLCSHIGRISFVIMSIPPTEMYRFNAIPTKLSMAFFTELDQTILKFVWNHKRSQIAKEMLREKHKAEESHFLISNYIIK